MRVIFMLKKMQTFSLILISFLLLLGSSYIDILQKEENDYKLQEKKSLKYQECMTNPYLSNKTLLRIQTFFQKYSSNNYALYFQDLTNEYKIVKNENRSFYGASLIKLLEATYLIRQALENKVNLQTETLIYKSYHRKGYSLKMENHRIGEKISLETLISYILLVSDNTAHEMLYEYIGCDNLKEYALSLNINLTITNKEHFGYLTAKETNNILKETYDIISMNNEYSKLLVNSMNNDYYNSLNYKNIHILHKFGYQNIYFHDIGIYNDEKNPYLISILTTAGEPVSFNLLTEIHQEIRIIYEKNIKEKEEYCKLYK